MIVLASKKRTNILDQRRTFGTPPLGQKHANKIPELVVVLVTLKVQKKLNTYSYSKLACHAFVSTDDNKHGSEQASVAISCDITR